MNIFQYWHFNIFVQTNEIIWRKWVFTYQKSFFKNNMLSRGFYSDFITCIWQVLIPNECFRRRNYLLHIVFAFYQGSRWKTMFCMYLQVSWPSNEYLSSVLPALPESFFTFCFLVLMWSEYLYVLRSTHAMRIQILISGRLTIRFHLRQCSLEMRPQSEIYIYETSKQLNLKIRANILYFATRIHLAILTYFLCHLLENARRCLCSSFLHN